MAAASSIACGKRDEFKSDFLFRMYLGIDMVKEDYGQLIEAEKAGVGERLTELLDYKPALAGMNDNIRYAYEFGIRTYQAQLDFLSTRPVPAPGQSRG